MFNFPFEVEHIIPISKQGADSEFNLALACRSCNLRKGNRVSGIDADSNTEVRFFHPRQDQWDNHFQVDTTSAMIVGTTEEGRITVDYLQMNSQPQIIARKLWIRLNLFP